MDKHEHNEGAQPSTSQPSQHSLLLGQQHLQHFFMEQFALSQQRQQQHQHQQGVLPASRQINEPENQMQNGSVTQMHSQIPVQQQWPSTALLPPTSHQLNPSNPKLVIAQQHCAPAAPPLPPGVLRPIPLRHQNSPSTSLLSQTQHQDPDFVDDPLVQQLQPPSSPQDLPLLKHLLKEAMGWKEKHDNVEQNAKYFSHLMFLQLDFVLKEGEDKMSVINNELVTAKELETSLQGIADRSTERNRVLARKNRLLHLKDACSLFDKTRFDAKILRKEMKKIQKDKKTELNELEWRIRKDSRKTAKERRRRLYSLVDELKKKHIEELDKERLDQEVALKNAEDERKSALDELEKHIRQQAIETSETRRRSTEAYVNRLKNKHSDALSKARIEKEEALGELEKRLKKEASERLQKADENTTKAQNDLIAAKAEAFKIRAQIATLQGNAAATKAENQRLAIANELLTQKLNAAITASIEEKKRIAQAMKMEKKKLLEEIEKRVRKKMSEIRCRARDRRKGALNRLEGRIRKQTRRTARAKRRRLYSFIGSLKTKHNETTTKQKLQIGRLKNALDRAGDRLHVAKEAAKRKAIEETERKLRKEMNETIAEFSRRANENIKAMEENHARDIEEQKREEPRKAMCDNSSQTDIIKNPNIKIVRKGSERLEQQVVRKPLVTLKRTRVMEAPSIDQPLESSTSPPTSPSACDDLSSTVKKACIPAQQFGSTTSSGHVKNTRRSYPKWDLQAAGEEPNRIQASMLNNLRCLLPRWELLAAEAILDAAQRPGSSQAEICDKIEHDFPQVVLRLGGWKEEISRVLASNLLLFDVSCDERARYSVNDAASSLELPFWESATVRALGAIPTNSSNYEQICAAIRLLFPKIAQEHHNWPYAVSKVLADNPRLFLLSYNMTPLYTINNDAREKVSMRWACYKKTLRSAVNGTFGGDGTLGNSPPGKI